VLLKRRTALECELRDCASAAVVVEEGCITATTVLTGLAYGRANRAPLPLSDVLEVSYYQLLSVELLILTERYSMLTIWC
jgi:hypothetical protein